MTGLDRLSYQSRWVHVSPVRKFLLWLVMMILAFTLPPLGQGIELPCSAGGNLLAGTESAVSAINYPTQTRARSSPVN